MRPAMETVMGVGGGLELLGGEAVVGGAQLGDGVGEGVAVGIGGVAEGGDLLELVAALLIEAFLKLGLVHGNSSDGCG